MVNCCHCKKRVDEMYATEFVMLRFLDIEKVYLCPSCYKLFVRFMEGKNIDSAVIVKKRNNDLKIAVERKRRKQRKSMDKDAVEMEIDLVYEIDEEDYE